MLWLYVGWLVLLLDSSVEFYYQNPEQVTLARGDATLSLRMVERLPVAFLTEITNQFTTADPQTTLEDLARKVGVPAGLAKNRSRRWPERDWSSSQPAAQNVGCRPARLAQSPCQRLWWRYGRTVKHPRWHLTESRYYLPPTGSYPTSSNAVMTFCPNFCSLT